MRLYPSAVIGQIRLGAELAGRFVDLHAAHAGRPGQETVGFAPSMLEFIRLGPDALTKAGRALVFVAKTTGTPAGIGYFRNPRIFLKPGDVCELEISGIGKLVNRVVADEYRFPKRRRAKRAA